MNTKFRNRQIFIVIIIIVVVSVVSVVVGRLAYYCNCVHRLRVVELTGIFSICFSLGIKCSRVFISQS